jgi:hypothetical protein
MFIIAEDCLTRKCGSGSVCINFLQTERLIHELHHLRLPLRMCVRKIIALAPDFSDGLIRLLRPLLPDTLIQESRDETTAWLG